LQGRDLTSDLAGVFCQLGRMTVQGYRAPTTATANTKSPSRAIFYSFISFVFTSV
jgi:hypothetical protein